MKVRHGTVPLRGGAVPVLEPYRRKGRLTAVHYGGGNPTVCGDAGGMHQLSQCMALAARWKEAVIFLPSMGFAPTWCTWEPCDLVLCHHSLALRRSRWKELRRCLRRRDVRSVNVPRIDRDFHIATPGLPPYRHDFADIEVVGRTMFVVGSDPIFRTLAKMAAWLVDARSEGDHNHLFGLSRHEHRTGAQDDLTFLWTGTWPMVRSGR
jgi:hypothetical protein